MRKFSWFHENRQHHLPGILPITTRVSPSQKLWARELIEKLGLSGNERVIDIGCGDGSVTAAIASRVPQGAVTGIDSSEEMIRFAKKQFPSRIVSEPFVCLHGCPKSYLY